MVKKFGGGTHFIIGKPDGPGDVQIALQTQTGSSSPHPSNINHLTSSFASNAELITPQQTGSGSLSKKYKLIGKLLNNLSNKYKKKEKTNLKTEINKLKL
jgi:hypothetical protein